MVVAFVDRIFLAKNAGGSGSTATGAGAGTGGGNDEALESAAQEIDQLIRRFRRWTGTRTDVILAGDFNRYDQLWGEMTSHRRGRAKETASLTS